MQDLYIIIYSSLQTLYIYGYFDLKILINNKIYKQEIYRHIKYFTNIIFYLICQINIREII